MKKYMVVERYRPGCYDTVYQRFDAQGRMLPHGLNYLNSWVNRERGVCYQLMETNDPALFDAWTPHWADLVDFEIVPID
ncbi:MAG: DUF3303 domain-containing protein [Candidatus Edwardsbacteria bacterium]|nr:DUF3303 domain-containing protein [Candidatus Edwardsbacteria bacterium]